ncbi:MULTISPECIES: hypothetical protein [Francisella]|uniref:YtxH domain-containing protein n=1 Tax=Francisella opportunistica TaxID=2016517 RepID=A0A345JRV4_9GAMM|nr:MULTISPECIES: hypothetical protein [Francisella]APC91801.1 hypothetical protein BBG19_1067 [Francisella sp. MA067296]AXH30050.1 hypothetical protein CGC43_05385 [Francisella opportunistica]AXH31694.1 hypothetical protein CGC44_05355 [Francisella opportunistica]AXH33340.1 hypothetical protein CGC45_05385 [Francisella opportunistica]
MKKVNPKKLAIILLVVGGVCLVVILAVRPFLSKEDISSNWDTVKEKVSDAGDAAATKTKKAYYKTKDAMTPDPADKLTKANDAL